MMPSEMTTDTLQLIIQESLRYRMYLLNKSLNPGHQIKVMFDCSLQSTMTEAQIFAKISTKLGFANLRVMVPLAPQVSGLMMRMKKSLGLRSLLRST